MALVNESSLDFFAKHLSTNTLGAFLMLQGLEPFLIKNQTHIISILSTAARYAYPGMSAYSSSQFGLKSLLEALQKEWRDYGIKWTPLYAGAVNTPLWDQNKEANSDHLMLTQEDFIYVFDFVLNAPFHLRIADLCFLHQRGFLE
jgi:NAD(P)-dependent dehydrogenase (short-subunit alcohol dehydrogenase family)